MILRSKVKFQRKNIDINIGKDMGVKSDILVRRNKYGRAG